MKKLLLILIIGLGLNKTFAHCPYCSMAILNANYGYDFKNKASIVGGNLNAYFLLINGGLDYKYMRQSHVGLKKGEIAGYIGIGFTSVIQFQYGYSTNKLNSLRLRSDVPLEFIFPKKDLGTYGLITFSMTYEHYMGTSKKNEYVSFGVGIPIIDFINGGTFIDYFRRG